MKWCGSEGESAGDAIMPDQGFDISSLTKFRPSGYLCQKCLALLDWDDWTFFAEDEVPVCPVCRVRYMPTDDFTGDRVTDYLKARGRKIVFKDLMAHSRTLAEIAQRARDSQHPKVWSQRPIQPLFHALLFANVFVHFVTYGISPLFVGAIKLAAQRVPMRGIVSNADSQAKDEFTVHGAEAPLLTVKLFERSDRPADWDAMPHQKLIVIDGLLAFKGSANLTTAGWRKSAQGLDVIEVVTDVTEVKELHNRYFCPIWARLGDIGAEIRVCSAGLAQ
jgi:hypothetical protein